MIFNVILLILALSIDLLTFFLTGLYQYIAFIWLPFIALPILFVLLFGVELLFFLIWSLFINKKKEIEKPSNFYAFIVNQVTYQLVFFSRTKITASGLDKLPNNTNYVILFNHLSNFDHMCMIVKLHINKIICVSKKGNEKIPIAGAFIHKAGYISFDREDKSSSANAAIKAIRCLRNYHYTVAIAPEGTRNKERKETLLPFHEGCFKIATKSHKPIVISVIKNTFMIHKNFPFKGTKVIFKIIETIPYEKYSTMEIDELKNYCYQVMKNELEAN